MERLIIYNDHAEKVARTYTSYRLDELTKIVPADEMPAVAAGGVHRIVHVHPDLPPFSVHVWGDIVLVGPAKWRSGGWITEILPWTPLGRVQFEAAKDDEDLGIEFKLLSEKADHREVLSFDSNRQEKLAAHTYNGKHSEVRPVNRIYGSYQEVVYDQVPVMYLDFEITLKGQNGNPDITRAAAFGFQFSEAGPAVFAKIDEATGEVALKSKFFGHYYEWTESLVIKQNPHGSHHSYENNPLDVMAMHLRGGTQGPTPMEWWANFFKFLPAPSADDDDRLKGTLNKKNIAPVLAELETAFPVEFAFFRWLKHGKTWDKKCNNSLLASFITATVGGGAAKMAEKLREAMLFLASTETVGSGYGYPDYVLSTSDGYKENLGKWYEARRAFCLQLPGAQEKAQEQEATADWSKRNGFSNQADGLGITADKYPKLRKAIEDGNIPTSVFRQPNQQPVNREFPLWERALSQKGWAEPLFEIAQDAGRRSTYEKDISPYLMFLFQLPKYLDRHAKTGAESNKRWSCFPKYVQSTAAEIETNENGTVKTRSAFTPIVDNAERTVTVPYVAVHIGGRRAQWCYSRHFHLFQEGFTDPISGGVVIKDYEEKLNGRDDYGLCFYTLIGTDTATGYPTFLIIFERLERGTRVHFHRVRPQRSKNGVTTPACELIEACYQYMAGNIHASEITAQQGDMIYIRYGDETKSPLDKNAKVGEPRISRTLGFESHSHIAKNGGLVELYPNQAKSPANRLGFLHVPDGGIAVRHPEHDDIEHLDAGWFEVRRCKSWEFTPTEQWSLTID